MRYPSDQAEKTRARIVDAAAEIMRERGPAGVGLAALMKEIGLTHGGFYAHFDSKDALVAAAVEHMFRSGGLLDRVSLEGQPERTLRRFVNAYLSPEHRDVPGTGCPVAALASELHRLETGARRNYERGIERIVGHIAALVPRRSRAERERVATSIFAELVGALTIARAIVDREQSDAILADVRAVLKERIASLFANGESAS
jgi:TetR/AcrR family transcriptional repressor of nem operon